jgi:paxillin
MVAPDGKLYCEPDFVELHAKKCKVCNELISGKMINISDESGGMMAFHSEHFICVCCGTNLVGKRYKVQKSSKAVFCISCMEKEEKAVRIEAHICGMCNLPIEGNYLLISGKFIHPRHYRCEECGVEFKGGDCMEYEGDYYCRQHYENLILKKCARCGKPCKGRSITACQKTWHPDHFMCHVCGTVLLQSNFYENDFLPYCLTDFTKLFGDACARCLLPIQGGGKRFIEKCYHDACFKCNTCNKDLKPGKFTSWDNKPICTPCYNKLPDDLKRRVEKRLKEEKKAKMGRVHQETKEREEVRKQNAKSNK